MTDEDKEVQRRRTIFRQALNTRYGVAMLEELKKAFVFTSGHAKGDPYESCYREGKRDLVLELMALAENRE